MPIIEIGIVYRFHADDDQHALEQFFDQLFGGTQYITAEALEAHINVVRELE